MRAGPRPARHVCASVQVVSGFTPRTRTLDPKPRPNQCPPPPPARSPCSPCPGGAHGAGRPAGRRRGGHHARVGRRRAPLLGQADARRGLHLWQEVRYSCTARRGAVRAYYSMMCWYGTAAGAGRCTSRAAPLAACARYGAVRDAAVRHDELHRAPYSRVRQAAAGKGQQGGGPTALEWAGRVHHTTGSTFAHTTVPCGTAVQLLQVRTAARGSALGIHCWD